MTSPNQQRPSTARVVPAALLLLFVLMAVHADGVELDENNSSAEPQAVEKPAAAAEDSTAAKPLPSQEQEQEREPARGPAVGSVVPEIEGEDIDGVPLKLSDYRGRVVMIDFWGDW